MQRTKLLPLLRCPEDRTELSPADDVVLRRMNDAISAGRLVNRGGRLLESAIEGGLVRRAGDVIYPVVHGIPLLLRDEGIALSQLPAGHSTNGAQ